MRHLSVNRRTVAAGLALLLVLAALAVWWQSRRTSPRWVAATVTVGTIERSVTMTGTLDPVNTVQVGSYVSGIVKDVRCDFNTEVKVGQLCARIDPQPFRLVVEQNRADIAIGEAQLRKDQAALTYDRLTFDRDANLLADGVVSADAVDNDRNVVAQAEAQIALDQANLTEKKAILKAAEVNLAYTDILSPVDGMVVTRNVDVGQTVVSNLQSSTLFLIARDLTHMQVDTNVAEADIAQVKVGQRASFTVQAYPDRVFKAEVRQIRQAPITVQSVVTYDVVLAVDNPQKLLLPGMTADTHIVTAHREQVLRVPLAALRFSPGGAGWRAGPWRGEQRGDGGERRGDGADHRGENGDRRGRGTHGARIWLIRDGVVTPVPVTVGLDDGSLTEISGEGVHQGDQVAIGEAGEDTPRRSPTPPPQRRPGPRF